LCFYNCHSEIIKEDLKIHSILTFSERENILHLVRNICYPLFSLSFSFLFKWLKEKILCFPHCLMKSVCLKFTKTRRDWSLMLNPRQPVMQTCLKFLVLVLFVWLRSLLLQLFYWSSPLGCSIVGRSGKGDITVPMQPTVSTNIICSSVLEFIFLLFLHYS